jgi:hypothetical protein
MRFLVEEGARSQESEVRMEPRPTRGSGARTSCVVVSLFLFAAAPAAAGPTTFSVLAAEGGAWPEILTSVGFRAAPANKAGIFVLRPGSAGSAEWPARVESGAFLILEGETSAADLYGFRKTAENTRVASVTDTHLPQLSIVWQAAQEMPRFEMPPAAQVFAKERWTGAPLIAGMRRGRGAVLWVAASPGLHGYERFPYVLHALADLGLGPPFRSARLWAFFDSAYRMRVDPDYFARRWRSAGIAALQVAAWHFFESTPADDAYLRDLIAACHRQGILVFAWLELPHVSEKFWNDHPDWREQTALQQDAHLDWRKLMNLQNRDCFRAAAQGVQDLLGRFDWDGVNLAELYFESLQGAANPAHFTPMNREIREEFRKLHQVDPLDLFRGPANQAGLRTFLDYRAGLASRMQSEWVAEIEKARAAHPDLDLVLTHIDDRFDRGMRDALGADVSGALPLADLHKLTFLVEDPATVWNLGPQRYKEIAARYPKTERLGIDINVVERYQDVYPTLQQTGTELFALVHQAAKAFPRVALYFENSIQAPDWKWLSAAAASVTRAEPMGDKRVVESPRGVGIPWQGAALVDGDPWPLRDETTVWLPPGTHAVEPAREGPRLRIETFNGELKSARAPDPDTVELVYQSTARALAVVNRKPRRVRIDGMEQTPVLYGEQTIALPRGRHVVTIQ